MLMFDFQFEENKIFLHLCNIYFHALAKEIEAFEGLINHYRNVLHCVAH